MPSCSCLSATSEAVTARVYFVLQRVKKPVTNSQPFVFLLWKKHRTQKRSLALLCISSQNENSTHTQLKNADIHSGERDCLIITDMRAANQNKRCCETAPLRAFLKHYKSKDFTQQVPSAFPYCQLEVP